jgi:hypothetical protein
MTTKKEHDIDVRTNPNHDCRPLFRDRAIEMYTPKRSEFTRTSLEVCKKHLMELSGDENTYVRAAVAVNKITPTKVLTRLSYDTTNMVAAFTAENASTSPKDLERLAKDKRVSVVRAVAENINTPLPTLEKLSKRKNRYVLFSVARNPKATRDMLIHIAKTTPYAHAAVSSHDAVPFEALLYIEPNSRIFGSLLPHLAETDFMTVADVMRFLEYDHVQRFHLEADLLRNPALTAESLAAFVDPDDAELLDIPVTWLIAMARLKQAEMVAA